MISATVKIDAEFQDLDTMDDVVHLIEHLMDYMALSVVVSSTVNHPRPERSSYYVIRRTDGLYWDNTLGWVDFDSATRYTRDEALQYDLPVVDDPRYDVKRIKVEEVR